MRRPLKILLWIAIGLCGLVFAILLALDLVLDARIPIPPARKGGVEVSLPWDGADNLVQVGNTCGAHSAMALLLASGSRKVDPYAAYADMPEKLGNGYLWPWGLTRYLKRQGVSAKTWWLGWLSDDRKAAFIERKLEQGRPVIIVVGTKKYLHYVTILGRSDRGFEIYDSGVEADLNRERPGNVTAPVREVLARMDSAVFEGFGIQLAIAE